MSWEDRYLFHSRLGELIVGWYANERQKIANDDPDREEKRAANRAACAEELKTLNRYFFGQKQVYACDGCPLWTYWAESEARRMDGDSIAKE